MSKLKKGIIVLVVFIGLGAIAKAYNERNHMDMAIEECSSQENIARVDSKGFECTAHT